MAKGIGKDGAKDVCRELILSFHAYNSAYILESFAVYPGTPDMFPAFTLLKERSRPMMYIPIPV